MPRSRCVNIQGALHSVGSAALINSNTASKKPCFKCNEAKKLEEFNKDIRTPDGRTGECKACRNLRQNRKQYNAKYKALHTDEFYAEVLTDKNQLKRCPTCERLLILRNYQKHRQAKSGFQTRCRECMASHDDRVLRRGRNLRSKYGITEEIYEAMLASQKGKCAICQEPPVGGKRLVVDHCHKGSHVRGLLCNHCNRAIGSLRDNPINAMAAADYLLRI